ncbi:MAG: hypothetical protein IBJ18_13965 [Phycisphaerales bacterium]|nr:hypothetical protein [Phycisphaerales bacterium]
MSDQIRVTPGVSRSTNPYHIARAYGAPAPAAATGVAAPVATGNSAPAAAVNGPSTAGAARAVAGAIKPAVVSGGGGVGAVQQPRVTAEALKKIDRLVAAEVPGKAVPDQVSVGASRADEVGTNRQQAAAYQLYRRPTEKNEVQTVLLVGRLLDTNG